MKSLLLLLAVGFAAGTFSEFRAGQEYRFRYESQAVMGVPHFSEQYAGMKFLAMCKVQMNSENQAIAQMDILRINKIKTEMQPYPENGLFPDSKLEPFENEISKEMITELSKPFSFTIENGRISQFEVDSTDAIWSGNVKKGFASLLQVNPDCDEAEKSQLDMWKSDLPERYEEFSRMNGGNICKVTETDVLGECESVYAEKADTKLSDNMELTKVRNLNRCKVAPVFMQGVISGLTFVPEFLNSQDVIDKHSWANYKLKQGVISYVRQDSEFIFTPTSMESGSAVSSNIQILTLERTMRIEQPIDNKGMQPCRRGLIFEFPSSALRQHEEYELGNNDLTNEQKLIVVEKMLDSIIRDIHPTLQDSAVDKVKALAEMLKRLSEDDLITLCEKYAAKTDQSNDERKRAVLLDLLPTLNSPKTVKALAKLMTSKLIGEVRSCLSMKTMSLTVTPNVGLIDFLLPDNEHFLAHPTIKNSPRMRRSAIVSVTAMIKRMIQQVRNEGYPASTVTSKLTTFVNQIQSMYKKCESKEDKFAVIFGMGNTGLPEMIPFLENVCKNKEESTSVRLTCLTALAKMPKVFSKRMQKTFASIYMDHKEEPNVRINAFVSLIDARPEDEIISLLTRSHNTDESSQVTCFVYTYLNTLANADLPGLRNISERLQRVQPLLKPCDAWMPSAVGSHFDYYMKQQRLGVGMEFMTSQSTTEPSLYVTRWMLHAFGKTTTPIDVTVTTSGVTQLLQKIFGVHSNLNLKDEEGMSYDQSWEDKSLKDIFKHMLTPLKTGHIDFGSVADEVMYVAEKLNIVNKPSLKDLDKLSFQMYISDTYLVDIKPKDIMEMIETGNSNYFGDLKELYNELRKGQSLDVLRILNAGRSTLMVPTPLGMSLSVNVSAIAVTHTTGSMKINAPSFTDMFHRAWSGSMPEQISLDANLKPSVRTETDITFGVHCGLVKSSVIVECKNAMELKFNTVGRLNTRERKFSVSIEGPKDAFKMRHETIPRVTVVTLTPGKTINPKSYDSLRLYNSHRMETVKFTMPARLPVFDASIDVKYTVPIVLPNWMPSTYIWASSIIELSGSPLQSSFSKFEIQYDTSRGESEIRKMLPSTFELNPMIRRSGEPEMVKVSVRLGPENSEENTCRWMMSVISSSDRQSYQISSLAKLPAVTTKPLSANLCFNKNAFNPKRLHEMNPNSAVCQLELKHGETDTMIKLFPDQSESFRWNMYKENNFFRLIESYTRTPITASIVKPVERTHPTLMYKLRMTTDIQLANMSPVTKYGLYAMAVVEYLKASLPILPASLIKQADSSPSSAIEGQLMIVPFEQKVMIDVRTPSQTRVAFNVPHFLYTPYSKLISVLKSSGKGRDYPQSYKSPESSMWHATSGECSIHRDHSKDIVTTFDHLSYKLPALPDHGCELLLVQERQLRLFSVLMTPEGATKALRVVVPHHDIKLVPSSSWSGSNKLKLIVDGQEISVNENTPTDLIETTPRRRVYATVNREGSWLHLHAAENLLVVSTNGEEVVIKTSGQMRGRLSGLCGNFDSEKFNDYNGPDMYPNRNSELMISKYVLERENGRCTQELVRQTFGVTKIAAEECERRVKRTVVKRNGDKTCFSRLPVMKCPEMCREVETELVDKSFHCDDPNNVKTQEYVAQSRYDVLRRMEFKEESDVLKVEIPTLCVPKY